MVYLACRNQPQLFVQGFLVGDKRFIDLLQGAALRPVKMQLLQLLPRASQSILCTLLHFGEFGGNLALSHRLPF